MIIGIIIAIIGLAVVSTSAYIVSAGKAERRCGNK